MKKITLLFSVLAMSFVGQKAMADELLAAPVEKIKAISTPSSIGLLVPRFTITPEPVVSLATTAPVPNIQQVPLATIQAALTPMISPVIPLTPEPLVRPSVVPAPVTERDNNYRVSASGNELISRQDTEWPSSLNERIFVEYAVGMDLPGQGWQSAYTLGGGGKVDMGFLFKDWWTVELDLEFFHFEGTNFTGSISDNQLMILPTIRYFLFSSDIRPYVSLGGGLECEFSASTKGNDTVENLDVALGFGVSLQLKGSSSIFVESKYNFIFAAQTTGQDIPLLAGGRFDF